jgi:hypothetical protein
MTDYEIGVLAQLAYNLSMIAWVSALRARIRKLEEPRKVYQDAKAARERYLP